MTQRRRIERLDLVIAQCLTESDEVRLRDRSLERMLDPFAREKERIADCKNAAALWNILRIFVENNVSLALKSRERSGVVIVEINKERRL